MPYLNGRPYVRFRTQSAALAKPLDVLDSRTCVEQHDLVVAANVTALNQFAQCGHTRCALRRNEQSLERSDFFYCCQQFFTRY